MIFKVVVFFVHFVCKCCGWPGLSLENTGWLLSFSSGDHLAGRADKLVSRSLHLSVTPLLAAVTLNNSSFGQRSFGASTKRTERDFPVGSAIRFFFLLAETWWNSVNLCVCSDFFLIDLH